MSDHQDKRKDTRRDLIVALILFGVMGGIGGMIFVFVFGLEEHVRVAQILGAIVGMVWAYKRT